MADPETPIQAAGVAGTMDAIFRVVLWCPYRDWLNASIAIMPSAMSAGTSIVTKALLSVGASSALINLWLTRNVMMSATSKRRFVPPPEFPCVATWPIFAWRRCEMCDSEFRREWGWEVLTGPWINGFGRFHYACLQCAPTQQDFVDFLASTRPVNQWHEFR
jgi:hypothetical protein